MPNTPTASSGLHPAVFLDRDGTLVEEVPYLHDPAELALLPGAAGALAALGAAGLGGIDLLHNVTAVVIGLTELLLPFMVLPIYSSLEKLDLSLLEAAEVLGARPAARFWKITFPLSVPGVVAGSLLVCVPALGAFLTPDLLGGAKQLMIGNLIQNQFAAARNWPFGSAASLVMLTLVLAAVVAWLRLRDRTEEPA